MRVRRCRREVREEGRKAREGGGSKGGRGELGGGGLIAIASKVGI